jgi:hypothetical protein
VTPTVSLTVVIRSQCFRAHAPACHFRYGLDESPHVYRRLPDVLAAQGDTVTVLHTFTPLIVVMA